MKHLAIILLAAAAAAIASPAAAQGADPGTWYAGAGYTRYEFDGADVGGVTGRLGYRFTRYLGAEGEVTVGVEDDDNAELDNAFGIYGVGTVPLTDSFDVFGRVGYQRVQVDGSGAFADVDDDGPGYGAGVNWRFSPNMGVRAEYTRLDADDADADTWSVSGVINF
jgi:hypothetical protein